MCGGAIISDFISGPRSQRLTSDYLWRDLNKPRCGKRFSKPLRSEVIDVNEDFEADFQNFKDDSDVEEDDDVIDVKPFTFSAARSPTLSRVKANPQKSMSNACSNSVQSSLNQNFSFVNNQDQDYYNTMGFLEEKPPTNQYASVNSIPPNGNIGVASNTAPAYFSSDQGSNSFEYSDFGWGEQSKTPEISSVLSATLESDESLFLEDANPKKKLKSDSENAMPTEENNANTLSEELSAFESQMKFLQMPYLEGSNWDASMDAFLNGDATQDGGNPVDLWSFDDFPSMVGAVF
ncbi:hypothetical protein FEM48_Zijuj01G0260800 [Ziziphus jujuba var. spinosa]|uniref:Ethylene-responsive transcription factor RAP2-12-like n=1 Tax=Ziziphus jujuba var. spinosa TaxID=714518 RepID=A0A978W4W8_ZIZJJ|nr:hypothetical protein FEM48_Zijuj01G0260800 [Ziziphus jujuba var. spinosa]